MNMLFRFCAVLFGPISLKPPASISENVIQDYCVMIL